MTLRGAGSYVTVDSSVRLSYRSTAEAACGGFVAESPADKRYQSIADVGAQQQRPRSSSSKCGQCRVDGRGTRLNTDLFCKDTLHDFRGPRLRVGLVTHSVPAVCSRSIAHSASDDSGECRHLQIICVTQEASPARYGTSL